MNLEVRAQRRSILMFTFSRNPAVLFKHDTTKFILWRRAMKVRKIQAFKAIGSLLSIGVQRVYL